MGWDHPRVGGEKEPYSVFRLSQQGSPPHGRGKGCRIHSGIKPPRITPAWAGKRNWAIGSRLLNWDHPRVGGEKGGAWWIIILFLGSPPHRRGKA